MFFIIGKLNEIFSASQFEARKGECDDLTTKTEIQGNITENIHWSQDNSIAKDQNSWNC